jgi:hypothetical protein
MKAEENKMKRSELRHLIREEISKVLSEETQDIAVLAKRLYKGEKTHAAVEAELGRALTPIEKAKVTKVVNKIDSEKFVAKYEKSEKARLASYKKRYEQGLLPLELHNYMGTPDSRYYTPKMETISPDFSNSYTSPKVEPSGTTTYYLKDKYIDTPVKAIRIGDETWSLEKVYQKFQGLGKKF